MMALAAPSVECAGGWDLRADTSTSEEFGDGDMSEG